MHEVYAESPAQTTETPPAATIVPSPEEQKAAWQSRAEDLATWGMNLVNRTDAWGTYTSTAERAAGKSANYCFPYKAEDRKPGTFTRAILLKHFRASRNEHVCGLYSTSPEQTCRWFAIDIDVHGDDEAHLADANERYAVHLQNKLAAMKFSTILRDSNGKGGFHLWGIFVELVPTAQLFAFLQTIAADYEQFGIKKPETFPKQPSIKRLGNYVRLPGRHHSRDHWPAIFNGSDWVWGHDAIDVILETPFNQPSLLPPLPPELEQSAEPRVEQKSAKRNGTFEGEDVIGKFNDENDVEDVLLNSGKGYRRAGQVDMLVRPGKEGHDGSVYIDSDANESWHYSENDPLYCDKYRRSAFDVFCNLHHAGDVGKATHAAAKLMGIDHKSRAEKEEKERHEEWEKIRAADHAKTAPQNEPSLTKESPVRAVVRLASSYTPRPVDWLWPHRIARGKLTLIAGDPGTGKSIFTIDLAARESTGSPLPDDPLGLRREPRSVVMLNAEDDAEDTIVPRSIAAGADLDRITILESVRYLAQDGKTRIRSFCLEDLPQLAEAIANANDPSLVVIDPVSAYLTGTDSHNNADVRGLLAPLSTLAAKHHVAIILVTHLSKGGGASAMYRAMGSLAFIAAARAAYAITKDKTDPSRRLFLPIKNNIGNDRDGLAYRLVSKGEVPVVAWERGAVTTTADEALDVNPNSMDDSPIDEAIDWLRGELYAGPVAVKDVRNKAKKDGISDRTLDRAREKLGVESGREGGIGAKGRWLWFYADERPNNATPA